MLLVGRLVEVDEGAVGLEGRGVVHGPLRTDVDLALALALALALVLALAMG